MDIFEFYNELIHNKIGQIEFKKKVKQASACVGKAADFLKNLKQEEADEMMDKIIKKVPEAAVKAYDDGIISEKVVENARKMTIIAPGELSEAIYKLNKTMLDIAKSEKQKGK